MAHPTPLHLNLTEEDGVEARAEAEEALTDEAASMLTV